MDLLINLISEQQKKIVQLQASAKEQERKYFMYLGAIQEAKQQLAAFELLQREASSSRKADSV